MQKEKSDCWASASADSLTAASNSVCWTRSAEKNRKNSPAPRTGSVTASVLESCNLAHRFSGINRATNVKTPDMISWQAGQGASSSREEQPRQDGDDLDRKSTRLNSSHQIISYAVFCLKKKNNTLQPITST